MTKWNDTFDVYILPFIKIRAKIRMKTIQLGYHYSRGTTTFFI